MEKCRNEANRSGVCRCQIRAYDKNAEGPARPLLADETSGTLLFPTKRPSSAGESGSCRSSHWSHKVGDLFRAFLDQGGPPCHSPAWSPGPRQGWAAGSDRFWPLELPVSRTFLYFLPIICSVHGYPVRRSGSYGGPRDPRSRSCSRFRESGMTLKFQRFEGVFTQGRVRDKQSGSQRGGGASSAGPASSPTLASAGKLGLS